MLSRSDANNNPNKGLMHDFAKKAKIMEINPRSPLIEGLLKRVKQLPAEDEERDLDAEDELREVASVLIDGAMVRSGFAVNDSNEYVSYFVLLSPSCCESSTTFPVGFSRASTAFSAVLSVYLRLRQPTRPSNPHLQWILSSRQRKSQRKNLSHSCSLTLSSQLRRSGRSRRLMKMVTR